MVLRVNDVSYKKGAFKRNFKKAELGNTYDVYLHRKKDVGDNYEQIEHGKMGVVVGSAADKFIQKVAYGCNRIDFVEFMSNRYLACFRESLIQVSTYLEIEDFTPFKFQEAAL